MKTHRTKFFVTVLAGLSVLLFSLPAISESAVKQQLKELEEEQALEMLLEPNAEDNAKTRALTNLAAELAEAGLVPSVDFSKGHLGATDKEGGARFVAPLNFSRKSEFAKRISLVAKALGSSDTAPRTICISTPDGSTERFNVSKTGEAILLKVLSVSKIEPIPMHRAQLDGRVVVLSGASIGDSLYTSMRKLGKSGRDEVSLSLEPLPQWQPVRLSLKTTAGQHVTIPVELDGADRKLQVTSGTYWVLNGVKTNIAFDQTQLGQMVLVAELMRQGSLKLTGLTMSDHYPVNRQPLESLHYTFNLLGAKSAWFASINHVIQPEMTARHTAGSCSLAVDFESGPHALKNSVGQDLGENIIDLGWQPMSVWHELGSIKPVPSGQTEMVVGYLTPPQCASNEGGLSPKEFDILMRLPKSCKALCKSVAGAARAIPADIRNGNVIKPKTPSISSFTSPVCEASCIAISEYRTCLNQRVSGDKRRRNKGLRHCERRRAATR
jgi:hypothetical protein